MNNRPEPPQRGDNKDSKNAPPGSPINNAQRIWLAVGAFVLLLFLLMIANSRSNFSAADTLGILLTFPFGSAALTAESRQTLRRSLRLARESDRIVISGRTDSVGPDEVNQQLALARALAVRNFIRDAVPDLPNVIAIDAKGRCCFIASNDDESGRSRNRRVEVVFTSMGVM